MRNPGKNPTTVLLVLVTALLGACASGPNKERQTVGCMQCGEIIDIRPQGATTRSAAPVLGAAPTTRVLEPANRLGLGTSATGGLPSAVSAGEVPVYRVDEMSRLTRRAEVVLRMDRGGVETLLVEDAHTLRIGERVRRVGNRLVPEPDAAGPN